MSKHSLLDIITSELKLELIEIPKQNSVSSDPLSGKETYAISVEIDEFFEKKMIIRSRPELNEYIPGIFT